MPDLLPVAISAAVVIALTGLGTYVAALAATIAITHAVRSRR